MKHCISVTIVDWTGKVDMMKRFRAYSPTEIGEDSHQVKVEIANEQDLWMLIHSTPKGESVTFSIATGN